MIGADDDRAFVFGDRDRLAEEVVRRVRGQLCRLRCRTPPVGRGKDIGRSRIPFVDVGANDKRAPRYGHGHTKAAVRCFIARFQFRFAGEGVDVQRVGGSASVHFDQRPAATQPQARRQHTPVRIPCQQTPVAKRRSAAREQQASSCETCAHVPSESDREGDASAPACGWRVDVEALLEAQGAVDVPLGHGAARVGDAVGRCVRLSAGKRAEGSRRAIAVDSERQPRGPRRDRHPARREGGVKTLGRVGRAQTGDVIALLLPAEGCRDDASRRERDRVDGRRGGCRGARVLHQQCRGDNGDQSQCGACTGAAGRRPHPMPQVPADRGSRGYRPGVKARPLPGRRQVQSKTHLRLHARLNARALANPRARAFNNL